MKKIISIFLIVFSIMIVKSNVGATVNQEFGEVVTRMEGQIQTTIITGEENIKEYQESLGEEYDPSLVAVYRKVDLSQSAVSEEVSPYLLFREYYLKNNYTTTYTDLNDVLKIYNIPAGTVSISESVSISNSFTADAGISAEILEYNLGFSVTGSQSFRVDWSQTYSYPVAIKVYPIYQNITGEVWDRDVWHDDFVGKFSVKRAMGDDIRVYRR